MSEVKLWNLRIEGSFAITQRPQALLALSDLIEFLPVRSVERQERDDEVDVVIAANGKYGDDPWPWLERLLKPLRYACSRNGSLSIRSETYNGEIVFKVETDVDRAERTARGGVSRAVQAFLEGKNTCAVLAGIVAWATSSRDRSIDLRRRLTAGIATTWQAPAELISSESPSAR